jgi:uridine phosphorylase
MEASALFVLASIYRKRAGGIMLIAANQESDDPNAGVVRDLGPLIETSIHAMKTVIRKDNNL